MKMIKRIILHAICAALILAPIGCTHSHRVVPWPSSGIYVGYYNFGYERSEFRPIGTTECWWLSGKLKPFFDVYMAPSATAEAKFKRPAYVVVRGSLSATGEHGHLGHYSRELVITEVIEMRETTKDETVEF